jgi:hypothetical protein
LGDGSFYQVGTASNFAGCATSIGFVAGFTPSGEWILNDTFDCGIYPATYYTWSQYQIGEFGNSYEWITENSNSGVIGGSAFFVGAGGATVGTNPMGVFSELALGGSGNPSTQDTLGPIGFNPALQYLTNSGWINVDHGKAYYYNAPCPPYNVRYEGGYPNADVEEGSGFSGACTSNGQGLW